MSYLRYLCLLAYCGIQSILSCVIVFLFLRLLYPMSPVSLDCQFWIALSVFPNICLLSFLVACFAWTVDEYRTHKSKISRIKPC